jgi:hypothetical protein
LQLNCSVSVLQLSKLSKKFLSSKRRASEN